ncbi:ribonuclease BN, putative [Roseibacterium elongatum DSM 19469]|uniref:Ribonuclease BN, putative n=1 Tax=Roseicyclus elongatus DSM 19469 TaxID=1294273 RepID=W8RV31_9RHOB|nr:YihY/virulence factor BrkB family protein [Roseibacterium elongatum]AHM05118.1 ribonuclease BN, putative [Roseibacterium elongatum DSM 19469]
MAQADSSRDTHTEQTARRPSQFGLADLKQAAQRVITRTGRDRIGLVAAGVAFYALLALFPGITALVALAGLILDPGDIIAPLENGTAALPPAAREILLGQVRDVAGGASASLNLAALAGLALAIYSASRGVANLMAGLNVAYEEEEARGFFALLALTLMLTLFLLITLSLVLAVFAILPAILALAGDRPALAMAAEIARWPLFFLMGALIFSTLYRFGPSRRAARWRWLAPGGLLACAFWIAGTAGFGWYVETLGSYAETFGALAGVIVLLLWLWLSAFAVLFGAVVDAELEHQTRHDSTVGPDRPMGARGAVKADSYAGDA